MQSFVVPFLLHVGARSTRTSASTRPTRCTAGCHLATRTHSTPCVPKMVGVFESWYNKHTEEPRLLGTSALPRAIHEFELTALYSELMYETWTFGNYLV